MNTFVKINAINYPAEIYGHVRDRDWDNRESKVIVLALTIQEALDLFVNRPPVVHRLRYPDNPTG